MNFTEALSINPAALACIVPALGFAIVAIWHQKSDLLVRLSLRLALLAVVIDAMWSIQRYILPVLAGISANNNFHIDALALGVREMLIELLWLLGACGLVIVCNLAVMMKRR